MKTNPLTLKDGYKADHRRQYPTGTELVYSNFTPRSTKYAAHVDGIPDHVVFFGLQYFIQWYLIDEWNTNFFNQEKEQVIMRYKRRMDAYLGPDAISVDHIEALHDLGYLPIQVDALPEGVSVNAKVPLFVIKNTVPEFFWLTNLLETILSAMIWKPCTSATTAQKYKTLMLKYCKETGADENFVPFQGHDFSFRGMAGVQDAVMSGAGHLLSFVGTDTIPAIDFLEDYYEADCEKELIGCSVAATEHSVMCMGSKDGEIETFKRLINETYPKGIVSIVSDTWDYWQVITEFLVTLKNDIVKREGKVVIRPDSGDPVDIICGKAIEVQNDNQNDLYAAYEAGFNFIKYKNVYYELKPQYPVSNRIRIREVENPVVHEMDGTIQTMWNIFGGTTTDLDYKVLDEHIGLIYGDSITLERCDQILKKLKLKGFASTNVVLGIGSFTYEYVTRDTNGFAMKATAGIVNGEVREIYKEPKTDDGLKKSAKGFLAVHKDENGEYYLEDQVTIEESENCEFETVFKNSHVTKTYTLAQIRENVNITTQKNLV